MIKHIVLFGLAEEADGRSKSENARMIKEQIENLIHLIPQVKKIEVGINADDAPAANHDLAIYAEFDSMDDLHIYNIHPEHKKAVAFITKVRTERVAVDYYSE